MSGAGPDDGVDVAPDARDEAAGAALAALRVQVSEATRADRSLAIAGGNTKQALARPMSGMPLSLAAHRGILAYSPSELVITARAGTPLAEIEAALAARGQMLGFEPPRFGAASTIGGVVAAGLSGPRRPYAGSVRDFVLGARIMNGLGEVLRFGGQVMKNVAGYDVSRLMAGSHGTLGVLVDVSIRVTPRPEREIDVCWQLAPQAALDRMTALARRPLALSGLAYDGDRLHARLAGNAAAVDELARSLAPDAVSDDLSVWDRLRDLPAQEPPAGLSLWRLCVPPAARALDLTGRSTWDWGGAQRWLLSDAPASRIEEAAREAGGYAACVRGAEGARFAALPAPILALHRALKRCFDPAGIFNPGCMYEDF